MKNREVSSSGRTAVRRRTLASRWLPLARLTAFTQDESGQSTILVAMCFTALLLFVGVGIDIGNMRAAKIRMQSAADAAAVAAALEIRQCGTTNNCTIMQTAAKSSLQENGYTSIGTATNCATPPSGYPITVTINNAPCALGPADPNYGKTTAVEAVITGVVPLQFAKLVGLNNVTVSARAEAARPSNPPCIYALDPHGAGAVSITAGVLMTFNCSIVDESDSSAAFACLIGLGINAPSVKVTGGAAGLICSVPNLKVSSPRPTPTDPLAYLPTPAVGACGYSSGNTYYGSSSNVNITLGGTYIFNPGTYCGGISITAATAANITFNPGVYVLTTGPGTLGLPTGGLNITLTLLSNIQGSGVTFYNYGPVGGFNIAAATPAGLSTVQLSAPTSGTYSGILFFQDKGNTYPATFTASLLSGSKFEGAYYIPSAPLTYAVSAVSSSYNIIVAKDVNFAVALATTFGNDYSALSGGSPVNGLSALLVQ